MEKFRIVEKTFGSGITVFIPEHLYDSRTNWYKNVCFEMSQFISSFHTKEEAIGKIKEYKIYKKNSKIVSEEIIEVVDETLVARL